MSGAADDCADVHHPQAGHALYVFSLDNQTGGIHMAMLHDANYRSEVVKRVRALRPDSPRQWGKMSADQMLWHVNCALENALGQRNIPSAKIPIPRPVLKFMVMKLPWRKNNPTAPEFVASGNYNFEAERERCITLIDALAAKSTDAPWPEHPAFGRMSGRDVSFLHAKHLNHHLRQFGV